MDDRTIRLAGIIKESVVDGKGIRYVLFSQGCTHNCKNCFNPETHSFTGGKLYDMDEIIEDIKKHPLHRGVTFSGGDPFEQADKFSYIAKSVKELGLNIWSYTGYTFEYILAHIEERESWKDYLKYIDVLVDGPYEDDKRDLSLAFRGSRNQRIIDVQSSLSAGKAVELNLDR